MSDGRRQRRGPTVHPRYSVVKLKIIKELLMDTRLIRYSCEGLAYAACELSSYLDKIYGGEHPIELGDAVAGCAYLSVNSSLSMLDGYDHSLVRYEDGVLRIEGDSELSLLFGVYDYLQLLGCRFWAARREYVPCGSEVLFADGYSRSFHSAFKYRTWVNRTNDSDVLSFLTKSRVNVVLGCGPWNPDFSSVHASLENADKVKSLGLKLRGPGHAWRELIPDEELFAEHPEYFPLFDGERKPNKRTACFSNPKVRAIFRENFGKYLDAHPYWDIFAFWPEDTLDHVYCSCPECAKMATQDWYLKLANECAELFFKRFPDKVFEIIGYNVTETPPSEGETFFNDGKNFLVNLCLGRTRDITVALDGEDGVVEANRKFLAKYNAWMDFLKGARYQGDVMVMDYYNTCAPNGQSVPCKAYRWDCETIRKDFLFYKAKGVAGLGAFSGFDMLAWPVPDYFWTYLKMQNNPSIASVAWNNEFHGGYWHDSEFGCEYRQIIRQLDELLHSDMPGNFDEIDEALARIKATKPRDIETSNLLATFIKYCKLLCRVYVAYKSRDIESASQGNEELNGFFAEHASILSSHIAPYPPLWINDWLGRLKRWGY